MDKKKVFLIVGILLVVIIIAMVGSCGPKKKGGHFVASVPSTEDSQNMPKLCKFFIDPSGSMRGYYNAGRVGGTNGITNVLINTITDLNKSKVSVIGYCDKVYNSKDAFKNAIKDGSVYNGAETLLVQMISKAIDSTNDTAISVIVSDMVLSCGPDAVKSHGENYNKEQANTLMAELRDELIDHKDIHVVLLKFEADYNGYYYYNYKEQKTKTFIDSLMHKRPWYMLFVGKEQNLRAVFSIEMLSQPIALWSSLDIKRMDIGAEITKGETLSWQISPETDNGKNGRIWYKQKNNQESSVYLTLKKPIQVPGYTRLAKDLECTGGIKSVDDLGDGKYRINLKPYSEIKFGPATVRWVSDEKSMDKNNSSIDDDVNATLADMQGRTWGFSYFLEGLRSAYNRGTTPQTIAEFTMEISNKQ